ncbi:hypothetical protein EJB05_11324 [Eragrostis curvula]|uniref:Uncharacterized protein n=1 Tax=Eragrostis curvula TaxID=38414 RepID=A0A5J9VR18_9POAL|nr:hypothetical protein EJB05_11324 [Eragrostis curvula]
MFVAAAAEATSASLLVTAEGARARDRGGRGHKRRAPGDRRRCESSSFRRLAMAHRRTELGRKTAYGVCYRNSDASFHMISQVGSESYKDEGCTSLQSVVRGLWVSGSLLSSRGSSSVRS